MCRNNKNKNIAINKPIFQQNCQSIKKYTKFKRVSHGWLLGVVGAGWAQGLGRGMQRHLWAQNDCYYTFLLLLLLSKPMSSPGGVERPTEGNGTSQQSRKRRQPKNVPGIRRTAPQWGVTPAYTYTLCMCVCVCCVQKFMFCLFICLCSAL